MAGQEGESKSRPRPVPRSKLGRATTLAEGGSNRKAAPAEEDFRRAASLAGRVDARLRAMFEAALPAAEEEK